MAEPSQSKSESAVCCAAGPAVTSIKHSGKGKVKNLDDLPVYIVGDMKKAKSVIIVIYDIFGWNTRNQNVFHFSDRIAEMTGQLVMMPDFFRGDPWPMDGELGTDLFFHWLKSVASELRTRKDLYESVIPYILDDLQKSKYATIGLCWGGLQSLVNAADQRFKCAAAIHGYLISAETILNVNVPLYYAPAKGDTSVKIVEKAYAGKTKVLKRNTRYRDCSHLPHGFVGARGDWSDPPTKKAVDQILEDLRQWYKKIFNL